MFLLLPLLCVSLSLVQTAEPGLNVVTADRTMNVATAERLVKAADESAEVETEEIVWTTKVRPAYLKKYEHGVVFAPDYPITEKSNVSTVYVEPEFKRFCNDCEDYWHPKCHHYPHIYDNSMGAVLKTLSPKSLAEMEADSDEYDDEDDEYEDDDDEYEEEDEEEEGAEEEGEGGDKPKKKPEVLMKAEEMEAMRERINQLNALQAEQQGHANVTLPEGHLDQKQINAVIRDAMAGKFANATTLREPDEETVAHTTVDGTTTTLEPETILFSVEHEHKITIYKELLDDADAVLDMRVNNALVSCPREFVIAQSGIPDVQLGVWTKVALPAGVVMGPFRGRVDLTNSHEDSEDRAKPADHVLHIHHPKTRQMLYQVDGRSNTLGNWCRYINAARHESEQNLEVFFDEGKPYPFFRTIKPIEKNTELLAEFGNEFRKGKYTSLVNVFFNQPLPKDLPQRQFPCSRCGVDQRNPIAIQRHRKVCNSTRSKKTPRPLKKKHRKDEDETEETEQAVWTPPKHTRPRPNRPGQQKKNKKN